MSSVRIGMADMRGASTLVLAALALLGGLAVAQAQDRTPSAGQLVPETLAPTVRETPQGIALPAPPETGAPAGSDTIFVEVGDVAIEGGDPAFADATKTALEPLRGRRVSVAEIYHAASVIERAYAGEGYFLTRVVVPPQTVKPRGELRLLVVEGFIESVSGEALPERARSRAVEVVSAVIGKRPLTLAAFERALLIAGDTAGLDLRTRLTVGTAPGSVRLILEGTHQPVNLALSADNSLTDTLGTWTATASGSLNSVLGFGEQIYVNLTGAPTHGFFEGDSPRRLAAGGLVLPIGLDGLVFNFEGAWSQTKPLILDEAVLPTDTEYTRLSARLSYPVLRTRSDTLVLRSAFDVVDEEQQASLFGSTNYDDKIRALRLGVDWGHAFSSTLQVNAGVTLSHGVDALGARGREDATVARRISIALAEADFTKVEGELRVLQELPWNFAAEASARGQYSFGNPLFKSEQFSIGGPRLLSGFDAGDVYGDSGWLARGELQHQTVVQGSAGGAALAPYLFAAHGMVYVSEGTVVEKAAVSATSFGGGLRATVAPNLTGLTALELGVEGARHLANELDDDGWRFNLYLAARY